MKILDWFKGLFGKNKVLKIEEKKDNNEENDVRTLDNNFENTLKEFVVEKAENSPRELFEMFRKKDISEGKLTKEQKEEIGKIYDEEIEKVKKSIEKRKQNIIRMKKKTEN